MISHWTYHRFRAKIYWLLRLVGSATETNISSAWDMYVKLHKQLGIFGNFFIFYFLFWGNNNVHQFSGRGARSAEGWRHYSPSARSTYYTTSILSTPLKRLFVRPWCRLLYTWNTSPQMSCGSFLFSTKCAICRIAMMKGMCAHTYSLQ